MSEYQELAICQYLDRLDNIGLPARRFMITGCANAILRRSHPADPIDPPPQVSIGHAAFWNDTRSILSGLNISNGFQYNGNTVYIAYFCLMDMVHIVPKSSLISAIITKSFPFAFLHTLLTFSDHLMLLSFNPISIFMLRQLMQPHALDDRTSTNLNSLQRLHLSVGRHIRKLQFFLPSDRLD